MRTSFRLVGLVAVACAVVACMTSGPGPKSGGDVPSAPTSASVPASTRTATHAPESTPAPTMTVHRSAAPVAVGTPIVIADLTGRILFDDFADLWAMNVDGSDVVDIATDPAGPEFDGAWSPDGEWVVYRDSTRGINVDDEIVVARADGTQKRNLTANPANDWGPDWSPDGDWIAFNSDREPGLLTGWLVHPDGTGLRRIAVDGWLEYPSFSPDGGRVAYMGAIGGNYEIFVADLDTGRRTQLTSSPGSDGWPAWSPDGRTIAFTSVRDDCGSVLPGATECWDTGDIGPHHDIWLVDVDGSNTRRVTSEFGQFVAWSPDSRNLLISGYALYLVRPDGTGRVELRAEGLGRALGGIPDWRQARLPTASPE